MSLEALLDRVISLQPEYATDVLLPVLDSGKIPRKLALRYLRQLYRRASLATNAFPYILALRGDADRTDELVKVFNDVGVDTYSIRLRVLKRMAVLDAASSTEMLRMLLEEHPDVAAGCQDRAIPSPLPRQYSFLLDLFPDRFGQITVALSSPQQVGSMLYALSMRASTTTSQWQSAFEQYIASTNCPSCTDRVVATTEVRNNIGRLLQLHLQQSGVPFTLQKRVAQAYCGVVHNLLTKRCVDSRARDGNMDVLVAQLLPAAQDLSRKYSLPSVDQQGITPQFGTGRVGLLIPPGLDESTAILNKLVTKINEGGSTETRSRFVQDVYRFCNAVLSQKDPSIDLFMRINATFLWTDSINDPECQRAGIDGIFSLLGRADSKQRSRAAWLLGTRYLLNLAKSPVPSVSHHVIDRLHHVTGDPELQVYFELDQRFSLVSHYEPHAASRIGAIMAAF